MRRPGPLLAIVAAGVAFAAGAAIGLVRRDATRPPPDAGPAPVDGGLADVAAPDALADDRADAAADADAGFAGWTVDDLPHDAGAPILDPAVDADGGIDLEALLALVPMERRDEASLAIARSILGSGSHRTNQGNPAISTHPITRAQCLERLRGVILQTPEQRAICGGPFEVPIHTGDAAAATTCIDAFEYPNQPCVLPFVFSYAIVAKKLCALAGKRLCTQEEWNTACEADPSGGPPRAYAYGDALDLDVCHTGREKSRTCNVDTALWKSCPSDTVPSGSFPQCRSRLGVFDQHGNVAEAMTRPQGGVTWVQLKGSAFFYDGEIYPDHCRYDPRWHVDPVDESWHTNYHLGFRCCRDVVPLKQRDAG